MQGESDSSCLEPERRGNVHLLFTNIDSESDQIGIEFGKTCVASFWVGAGLVWQVTGWLADWLAAWTGGYVARWVSG